MTSTETRPFNFEAAKAGAPIATRAGNRVQILKWDLLGLFPIFGCEEPDTSGTVYRWGKDGVWVPGQTAYADLVMLPLCELEGKPVFPGDLLETLTATGWQPHVASVNKLWLSNPDFYRWPRAPTPKSNMTDDELDRVRSYANGSMTQARRAVADAAIERALRDGSVVLPLGSNTMGATDARSNVEEAPEPSLADSLRELAEKVRKLPLRSIADADSAFTIASKLDILARG